MRKRKLQLYLQLQQFLCKVETLLILNHVNSWTCWSAHLLRQFQKKLSIALKLSFKDWRMLTLQPLLMIKSSQCQLRLGQRYSFNSKSNMTNLFWKLVHCLKYLPSILFQSFKVSLWEKINLLLVMKLILRPLTTAMQETLWEVSSLTENSFFFNFQTFHHLGELGSPLLID